MYNLRPRKAINYDENSYFDSIGVKEMMIKRIDKKAYSEKYKLQLIMTLRHNLALAHNAPINIRHFYAIECIENGMEYIRKIGDSENFKLAVKNKIQEFKDEPKILCFKNKLEKYLDELNN
jgi:hypothetical protein